MNISSSALSLRTLVPIITEQLGVDVMNALGCSRERSTALTTSPPATSDGYRCTDGRELASGRRRVLLVEPQCRSPRVITSLIPFPGPAAWPPGVVRSDHPASSEWNGPVEEPTISSHLWWSALRLPSGSASWFPLWIPIGDPDVPPRIAITTPSPVVESSEQAVRPRLVVFLIDP